MLTYKKILEKNFPFVATKMLNGFFWATIGSVMSQGIVLTSNFFIAQLLGITFYGEYAIIKSTISIFALFAGLGIGLTTTKFISQYKILDKIKTGKIMGIATFFTLFSSFILIFLIIIFSSFIASEFLNAPHLSKTIKLSSFVIFFSAVSGLYNGSLVGFEAYKSIAKVNFFSALLFFPAQIFLTIYFKLDGALIGLGIYYILSCVFNYIEVVKEKNKYNIEIQYKNFWDELPVIYKFTLPAFLSGIMVTPVLWMCNTFLVNQKNGYSQMAIFDGANQWRMAILFLPGVIAQIALPAFSKNASDITKFSRILKNNILLITIISCVVAMPVSFLSKLLMSFYGKDFVEGYTVLIILSISTILSSINSVIGQAIIGRGHMWSGFFMNFLWGISILSFAYFYSKNNGGALGFAKAFLFSYLIHSVVQIIYLNFFSHNKV